VGIPTKTGKIPSKRDRKQSGAARQAHPDGHDKYSKLAGVEERHFAKLFQTTYNTVTQFFDYLPCRQEKLDTLNRRDKKMPSGAAQTEAAHLRHRAPQQGTHQQRQRRPSGAAETLVAAAKHVEEKVESALLVLWDELPHWRRDNAFIIRGYRQTSNSVRASLASLGYLHNETVNIWTHLLGAVAFAVVGVLLHALIAPRYESASDSDVLVFGCFFVGAFLCLGMSATYHMLSNHSPEVAKWGNKLDYTGIVFLIVGSYVPAMYYGFFCHPFLLTVYLSAVSSPSLPIVPEIRVYFDRRMQIVFLGTGCLVVSWFEHFRTPAWRPYRALMFVGLGVSGIVPILHSLSFYGYRELDRRMGLSWVILQGGFYIFGAFLYVVSFSALRHSVIDRIVADIAVGAVAGAPLSGHFRYLGELSSDIPCLCASCSGSAFVRHG
jgi:adiponectin receptor